MKIAGQQEAEIEKRLAEGQWTLKGCLGSAYRVDPGDLADLAALVDPE